MQINLPKYLSLIRTLMNEYRCWVDIPDKPLHFDLNEHGEVVKISVRKLTMKTEENYQLKYAEYGDVSLDGFYTINSHSYHFEGSTNPKKPLRSYRIDLERNGDLHANPDPNDTHLPHRMYYPRDIELDITDFSLPLAIKVAGEYLRYEQYPLLREHAHIYNDHLDRLRKELK